MISYNLDKERESERPRENQREKEREVSKRKYLEGASPEQEGLKAEVEAVTTDKRSPMMGEQVTTT